jgi:hypothetical protein
MYRPAMAASTTDEVMDVLGQQVSCLALAIVGGFSNRSQLKMLSKHKRIS